MSFSESIETNAQASKVAFIDGSLIVELRDGRTISVPMDWYPRLLEATPSELSAWELTGGGSGIHWPELDEDISIEGLLGGRRSMESEKSLAKWRKSRS